MKRLYELIKGKREVKREPMETFHRFMVFDTRRKTYSVNMDIAPRRQGK